MINLNIHEDLLQSLNQNLSLNQKLGIIHQAVRNYFDFIQRIAVALYEDQSDIIKTFLASCDRSNPLIHYESKLADAHSLKKISEDCLPRVVNDLSIFDAGEHEHTLKIKAEGYQARIVAVADIFDALTNERPYKKAWSNEEAFKTLRKLVDDVLDQDCVNALTSNETKILEIQNTFCN